MHPRPFALGALALLAACRDASPTASSETAYPPPVARSADAESEKPAPSASIAAPSATPPPGPCGDDMRLVEGDYCPAAEEVCLAWQEVNVAGTVERNQCKEYKRPSRCLSPRRVPMRFCMDTFEWPNEKGAIPLDLVSWNEAKEKCESVGKRLCTDVEFTFACEGEEMRPHVYGFDRDASKCSFDRPYRLRTFAFTHHDECLADPACKAALDAIDQRLPAGSMPECTSPEGIYDLNGNVNEWVMLPGHGLSKRAGLKGGWWGPVRDRCRPITTFHGESDYGYEVGFRCCRDAPSPG